MFFMTKKHLTACLTSDLKIKYIMCSNVAGSVETIRDEIDRWLNEVGTLEGDDMMV